MRSNIEFTISKVLKRLPFKKIEYKYNAHRHNRVKKELAPFFEEAYNSFTRYSEQKVNNTVWIFWWQGEDSMPPIVLKCYKSILTNASNKKVILITKENIKSFTDIPDYIFDKLENGNITFTHFSDILRANLLKNNGGLWMDATLYVTRSLDNIDLSKLYYCSGYPSESFNISYGRWTGFFMGGPSGMDLMSFMDQVYRIYWKTESKIPDYFFIDYALDYAWNKNISNFRSLEKEYATNEPHLFDLQEILNNRFSQQTMNLLTADTNVFKLSYKKKINFNDNDNFFNNLGGEYFDDEA